MKKYCTMVITLLIGTATATGFAIYNTAQEAKAAIAEQKSPQVNAQRFLSAVTQARIALAMEKSAVAQTHIVTAQEALAELKKSAKAKPEYVKTSRLSYDYPTTYRDHYYPLAAGPVELKTLQSGPFWNNDGLAVTDAEIAMVKLDFSNNMLEQQLEAATAALKTGKDTNAEHHLERIMQEIIKIDARTAQPITKARDNIVLARAFIQANNIDGARYALRYANQALSEMEEDKRYTKRKSAIETMNEEITDLRRAVQQGDPVVIEQADSKLEKWWTDLEGWTQDSVAEVKN